MKRFWKKAGHRDGAILLDERPVKTPLRAPLVVTSLALADAIVAEWDAQGEEVDPRSMPLTGLSNAAIDRVDLARDSFAADLGRYAETDLLCYRADSPAELVARQSEQWDPLLDWARGRYDIHFEIVQGIIHRPQPDATVKRLGSALAQLDSFQLAGASQLVTISGSLVASLALIEGAVEADQAFDLSHLDELWQVEQWGEDTLATEARAARKKDFLSAARFIGLLAS